MQLKALTKLECELVRQWRNQDLSIWRTPYYLTEEMQADFYDNVVCNRNSGSRYWGIHYDCKDLQPEKECYHFCGIVGLINISLENRNAELSILINPDLQKHSYGSEALKLLLKTGFYELNLDNIYGECYESSISIGFWKKIIERYGLYSVILPEKKFWNGKLNNSVWFNFNKKIMEKI